MALVLKDRVKEQSTTTGTGTLTLSGAFDGYQAFSVIGNGNVTYYTIYDPASGDWEVGYGTYTASGTTLSRDFVYDSSNSGNLVNFAVGTKEVFCTYPSEQAVYQETNGNLRLINGVIEVSIDGTSGTTLPNATFQAFSTTNGYIQNNIQNLSGGADASSDFVATNDQGSDSAFYADMGINSSGFNSATYPIYTPNSGYLYSVGDAGANPSTLFVGSGDGDVVLHAGGFDTANIVGTASGTDQSMAFTSDVSVGGDFSATGAADFGSTVLLNADPTLALQAATKQYVDNAVSNGFHVHEPVLVATTGNLTATYNNGSSGVGATLTNSGAQAAISIDGVSLAVNDRVLVWQQSSQAQNGVYVVTTVGSGSTNWVLTRASDADTYVPQSDTGLGGGDYFFVSSGATLGFSSYVCTNDGAITFGTTAITFQQFSTVPSYVVNAPLNLTGNTLSLSGTVAATNGGTGTNTVTTGDLLYGSGTNAWSKLAAGGQYRVLTMGASTPEWNALALDQANAVSGTLPESHGGTNQSSYATGDTLYASATNTLSKLSGNTSTTRKFLGQTGTGSASAAPVWDTVAASDIASGTLAVARGGTGLGSYAVGDIVYASGTGTLAGLADVATGNVLLSGGTNTAPSYGKVNLGTHIAGTLPVANGGTGQTTAQAAMNALAGAVTSGYYLRGNGTNVVMAAISAGDVPTLNQNTTGSAGSVINALTMNNGGAGDASGTTFNGSAARTISYNTIGASPLAGSTSLTTTGTVTSGTWSASFGAVSGANLTNLTAGNLSGTIPSAVLGNSTVYVGTTATALNRASANQALTGISSVTMPGSVSGTVQVIPASAAGTGTVFTIPATTGTAITTGDTGTVTNTMLAGSIANAKLANSSVTINGSAVSLGGSVTVTATATNALTIGSYLTGTSYNGSAAVTIAANAATAATGSTLVARDANGDTNARYSNASYFNSSDDVSAGSLTYLMGKFGDNYYRSATAAKVATFISGQTMNISGSSTSCSGNSATATTLIGDQTNWASYRSSAVANMLGWKNYSNGHVIFDASNGTSPTGSAVNNTNAAIAWSATYPTLMGWNGSSTYGVRVDSARVADSATSATQFMSSSHPGSYWLVNNWDGTYWYITSNHGAGVRVARADSAASASSASYAAYLSGAPAYTNGSDGWWRSSGQAGWYNSDYAVGIYATEAGNVRTYNSANFISSGTVTAANPFFLNPTTVSANYTIPANYNASSAGPITINTGVTVTVSTGSNWVIV